MDTGGMAALRPGLWGVLATPFTDDAARVDDASLARQVEYQLRSGATGLVALGVFGEAARLTPDERLRVLEVVDRTAPGVPLVAGLTERETADAIDSARRALDTLATVPSLMVQVPTSDPAMLTEHLAAIHQATGAGLVVQDYPVISGVTIGTGELLAAIAGADFVVAVKSESPPTSVAIAELAAETSTPVFGGLGGLGLLDELAAGAAGAITGFSHPEGLSAALRAWDEGGYPLAREAFLPWLPLVNFEAQVRIGLAVRKAALAERGIFASGAVRSPAPSLPPALLPILRAHLAHVPSTWDGS